MEPQGLIYEFTAALTVICFQPAIHAADHAGAQPDRSAFLVIIHSSSFLSVTSVKIAAKPCKHGGLPDDRLRLFCKTAKPTAVCVSLKAPHCGLCGRAARISDCGPLSCAKIERPSPLEKPSCKVQLFAQNRSRNYRQKVTATTPSQTAFHRIFQPLAQTAHVRFHG